MPMIFTFLTQARRTQRQVRFASHEVPHARCCNACIGRLASIRDVFTKLQKRDANCWFAAKQEDVQRRRNGFPCNTQSSTGILFAERNTNDDDDDHNVTTRKRARKRVRESV